MNNKKIALFTIPGPWSGVEAHTVELANALTSHGHTVTFVEVDSQPYSKSGKVIEAEFRYLSTKAETEGGNRIINVSSIAAWKAFFVSLHVDIIVLVKGTFKFGSVAIEFAARSSCSRLVAIEHMHSPLPRETTKTPLTHLLFKGWWRKRARLAGFIRSIAPNRVICVSLASAKTLTDDYLYPAKKVYVCHSGVDLEKFKPNSQARTSIRTEYSIPKNSVVFGSVGRLSPMKNHALMIKGFEKLVKANPKKDVHLLIVGDGPLKEDLITLTKNTGIKNKIHFSGFSKEPGKFYCAFDFFCLTSTGEAFPLVLLEAMATNNRPIATNVGGVGEGFTKEIGYLVTSDNLNMVAQAMEDAADSINNGQYYEAPLPREHVRKLFSKQQKIDNLIKTIVM